MRINIVLMLSWLTSLLALIFLPCFAENVSDKEGNNTSEIAQFNTLGMDISAEEQAAIVKAMEYGREISKAAEKINGHPYRRDAHAKATGCVRATFTINGNIPEHFQYSVFSEPEKEYKAWIRFSNGDMTVQADSKPDARGMAIKVMGVTGEKIASELPGEGSQDFIMTNTPAFFNRNIFDYVDDMYYLSKLQRTKWFISFFPPRLHPKLLYRATQTVSAKINTPLQPQYYSMLPYQLNHTQLKFSARPCSGMVFESTVDKSAKDYLTETMQEHLLSGSACFDFMVQEKVAGADMPLDDASVIWSENESPFIPIAKINIPAQHFTGEQQNQFCEDLSMNPWHGVGDWQPLGSLNRARRLVYYGVSQYRHDKNDAIISEPSSWCLNGEDGCDLSEIFITSPSPESGKLEFDSQYNPLKTTVN